jgi:hypothetical protein
MDSFVEIQPAFRYDEGTLKEERRLIGTLFDLTGLTGDR